MATENKVLIDVRTPIRKVGHLLTPGQLRNLAAYTKKRKLEDVRLWLYGQNQYVRIGYLYQEDKDKRYELNKRYGIHCLLEEDLKGIKFDGWNHHDMLLIECPCDSCAAELELRQLGRFGLIEYVENL